MSRIANRGRFFQETGSMGAWPVVSNEEAELVVEEQADDLASADADLGEVYRLQDVVEKTDESANYIEDTINAKADDEGATEGEVALAEQVADLATAGTGDSAETVMPAVESYIGSKISVEGFRQVVRNVIDAIKRAITAIIDRLKSYWRKMTSRLSAMVRSAEDLKKRANAASGKTAKEKKISVSGSTATKVGYEGKAVRTGAELLTGVRDLKDFADKVTNGWCPSIASLGEKLADKLSSFDVEKAVEDLGSLNTVIEGHIQSAEKKLPAMSSSSDSRYTNSDVKVESSKPLLGGKSLFCVTAKQNGDNAVSKAQAIQDSSYFLADSKKDQKDADNAEIDTLTPSQAGDIAEEVIRAAEMLRKYTEGKGLKDLEKAGDNVKKAADKLGSQKHDENVKQENQTATRRAFYYGSAFAKWTKDPHASVASHTCSVLRAAMGVANQSMSQYS